MCVGLVVTHVVRLETIVTNERDLNRLKDLVAKGIRHLHHFAVVVARIKDGTDAEEHRLLHRKQRHHDL